MPYFRPSAGDQGLDHTPEGQESARVGRRVELQTLAGGARAITVGRRPTKAVGPCQSEVESEPDAAPVDG
jgi:hypothetical protein